MEILTKAYGKVEIDPANIIVFNKGIIGFENKTKFILLGKDENELLLWLQSIEDEKLAFVVAQPRFFKSDYHPKIHIQEMKELDVEDQEDILLYTIIVVPEDIKKMTANLRAPIIINVKNNKAQQIVLNDDSYNVKELVFPETD